MGKQTASPLPEYWLLKDEKGESVRVTGILLKKGGSRGGRRNWQKRYFILEPTRARLRYYSDRKLKKQNGCVSLLTSTEIVTSEIPEFKGRHRPSFTNEDPFYIELRDVCDGEGRPRPFGFAVRALSETEYSDWIRSLGFSIRQLQKQAFKVSEANIRRSSIRKSLKPGSDDLCPLTFEEKQLGITLNLSKRIDDEAKVIVLESANTDFTKTLLRPGDELVAILPPSISPQDYDDLLEVPGAALIGLDTTPDDFEVITETLRDAPRPLSLVFRRKRLSARQCIHLPTTEKRQPSVSSSASSDDDDDDLNDDLHDLLDNYNLLPDTEFCILNNDSDTKYTTFTLASMRAAWNQGDLKPDSKIFLSDAWTPLSEIPTLLNRLNNNNTQQD